MNLIGNGYRAQGDFDTSLKYYEKSLEIANEIGNQHFIAGMVNNVGSIYRSKGELDAALEFFQKGLLISEENGFQQVTATSYSNIGNIYDQRGELDNALKYHEKSLQIKEEIGNDQPIANSFESIGNIYFQRGELDKALEFYQKCLRLSEVMGNPLGLSSILFTTLNLMLKKDMKLANDYLRQLQQISDENDNKIISQRSRFAEALILKSSNRGRLMSKAHDILELLVREEIGLFEITRDSILNLCEILLIEYKNFESEEILEESIVLLDQLYEKALKQGSFPILIESLILKARVEILQGEFEPATQLLENARSFVTERGITGLIPKIQLEEKKMSDNMDKWKTMLDKTSSARDRMNQIEIEVDLKRVIKYSGKR
ncbi:MAG: tetratricopeptide repeat protein [Candidatus Heimdallarchaeota archaeon]|nr:tetratricopeptide repeat protein [Candidatus Heimdallarchaeota archaeon]